MLRGLENGTLQDINPEIRDQGVEIPEPDGDSLRLYATA